MLQAIELCGGSHDGLRRELDSNGFPYTLWAITTDDGEPYARTADEFVDENGQRRVLFRHDPDGALREAARRAYSDAADLPDDN